MIITTFNEVPIGSRVIRLQSKFSPCYTKISNNYNYDVASGYPEGNVAPYAGLNKDEAVIMLSTQEAADYEECFRQYQLGASIKDFCMLKDGEVWVKARIMKTDELPSTHIFK